MQKATLAKCDSAMRILNVTGSDLLPIGEKEKLKMTDANEDGESQTMEINTVYHTGMLWAG